MTHGQTLALFGMALLLLVLPFVVVRTGKVIVYGCTVERKKDPVGFWLFAIIYTVPVFAIFMVILKSALHFF